MLIGGLLVLFSLLLGSDQLPLLIPEEGKAIKKVIVDKETRIKLNLLFKRVEEKEKEYKKDRKNFLKLLDKVTKKQSSSAEDFAKVGTGFQELNADVYEFMVDIRRSLGIYITDKEWEEIIGYSYKEYYKADKDYEKAWPKFEKRINKLNSRVRSAMSDSKSSNPIQKKLTAFGLLTLKNAKLLNTYNVYENEVFNNIHSTKEELEAVSAELLKLRAEVFEEYIAIHQLIASNTSPEEWDKIVNHLNKLF